MSLDEIPDSYNFPKQEEKILKLWEEIDAFRTSLKLSEGRKRYSFYDGPPFATGLPHYGHILAGTIKDIVTRYAHQTGHYVERRFGWDCHGLPVEYEIDKTLGITGPADVEKMGIAAYNAKCREIVMRYSKDWEFVVTRLGRWIDFENDYKTLYPWFMESVWWVFAELHKKGLVYRGSKVMPYSTGCLTPLSNFEANQNYKDVQDPTVIVGFPLDEEPDVSLVAWTTTPWTLPSNLALCVHPKKVYVKILDIPTGKKLIMMEARLSELYNKKGDTDKYKVLDSFNGEVLAGKGYTPLFPYFAARKTQGNFVVLCDEFVTEESGTGIVHCAPAFGEDDYRVCLKSGVISKGDVPCPVDVSGAFTADVTDFAGKYVKDADKEIIKHLKTSGRLVHQATITHSYPFCWRSETPLIYKAVPSWFIRVEDLKARLLANNTKSYWVPDFVREKRFHNWLADARDWAVSRNRYWGTPMPLWVSDDYEEVVCVSSIEELKQLSGIQDITDIHREFIDNITIPSKMGKGVLRRTPEVFDCWFESGSMPYAQSHYPFEKKEAFEQSFPADFIAEGLDQTRGWFYTLLVISTALFDQPPFKNLIVNGLVLAADGQKMSKRKKNYPDPLEVINKYGSDALRVYLINSPVVRAESLRFKEEGVRDVIKDVLLPWYNAFRFFLQNTDRLTKVDAINFKYDPTTVAVSENRMDRWILAFTHTLIKFVRTEMAAYRLYTVVPRLLKYIDNLTNWYVRANRKRLRGDSGLDECTKSLSTLFEVLFTMSKLMAPFTPFLAEFMFHHLRKFLAKPELEGVDVRSIHFLLVPEVREQDAAESSIVRAVERMQTVIDLARVVRERKTFPIKYPLPELVIIHPNEEYRRDIESLADFVVDELNVRKLTVTANEADFGVSYRAEGNPQLGKTLKGKFQSVGKAIKALDNEAIKAFQQSGSIVVEGETLGSDDIKIVRVFAQGGDRYDSNSDSDVLVLLDVKPDQAMRDEGTARETKNRVQKLRKKANLKPTDPIGLFYAVPKDDAEVRLGHVISASQADFLSKALKQPLLAKDQMPADAEVIITEDSKIKGAELKLWITRA
eukprot:Opistho-2@37120